MADTDAIQVSNNESESRFEARVGDKVGMVEYETRPGAIVLTHTEVPPELGGRGIAQALVKTALDHARAQGLKVVPLCSYAASYIERHPEYRDLVSD
jgi:predicted GNAT family acetyltransferase